jgi:hypothetical protein
MRMETSFRHEQRATSVQTSLKTSTAFRSPPTPGSRRRAPASLCARAATAGAGIRLRKRLNGGVCMASPLISLPSWTATQMSSAPWGRVPLTTALV